MMLYVHFYVQLVKTNAHVKINILFFVLFLVHRALLFSSSLLKIIRNEK